MCWLQLERAELPGALAARPELGYSGEAAAIEAAGVQDNRLQNLAITLDKAKLFMRHQTPQMQVTVSVPDECCQLGGVCAAMPRLAGTCMTACLDAKVIASMWPHTPVC